MRGEQERKLGLLSALCQALRKSASVRTAEETPVCVCGLGSEPRVECVLGERSAAEPHYTSGPEAPF